MWSFPFSSRTFRLSSLIRKVELGKIDANTAGKICFLANVMLKVLEAGDFERRLRTLEEISS